MTPKASHEAILDAAMHFAALDGYNNLRRDPIALRAGVANGSVTNLAGNMQGLQDQVMRRAVATEHLGIVAQGLAHGDPIAQQAPDELKRKALANLL